MTGVTNSKLLHKRMPALNSPKQNMHAPTKAESAHCNWLTPCGSKTATKQTQKTAQTKNKKNQNNTNKPKKSTAGGLFFVPEPVAGLRYLRLTRLRRHDRGPVPGGNRSVASCPCTVLRRASYHYATRSPEEHGRWSADQFVGIMEYKKDDIIVSPKGLV